MKVATDPSELVWEAKIYSRLNHNNILKAECASEDGTKLVLEYYGNGDLWDKNFSDSDIKFIAVHLISAVSYMHLQNISHFDIKPDNILANDHKIALADFGLAQLSDQIVHGLGTPHFAAPEVRRCMKLGRFCDLSQIGPAADWFSVGTSLLTIMYPDYGAMSTGNFQRVVDNYLFPSSMDPEFEQLLKVMLQSKPENRNFSSRHQISLLTNLPYFAGVRWDEILDPRLLSTPFPNILRTPSLGIPSDPMSVDMTSIHEPIPMDLDTADLSIDDYPNIDSEYRVKRVLQSHKRLLQSRVPRIRTIRQQDHQKKRTKLQIIDNPNNPLSSMYVPKLAPPEEDSPVYIPRERRQPMYVPHGNQRIIYKDERDSNIYLQDMHNSFDVCSILATGIVVMGAATMVDWFCF